MSRQAWAFSSFQLSLQPAKYTLLAPYCILADLENNMILIAADMQLILLILYMLQD